MNLDEQFEARMNEPERDAGNAPDDEEIIRAETVLQSMMPTYERVVGEELIQVGDLAWIPSLGRFEAIKLPKGRRWKANQFIFIIREQEIF